MGCLRGGLTAASATLAQDPAVRQVLKPGTLERCRNGRGEGLIVRILLCPASPIELPFVAIK